MTAPIRRSLQVPPDGRAAVALVPGHPVRPHPRPSSSRSLDRAPLHQHRQHRLLVPLATRSARRPSACRPARSADGSSCCTRRGSAQRLGCRIPPLAPAACWWARTTVLSTKCRRPVQPSLRIRLPLQCRQDAIPDPGLLPPIEAGGDRLPRAVSLGQGAPRTAGAQDPEDAVEDRPVVVSGTTGTGLLRGSSGRSRSHCASVKSLVSMRRSVDRQEFADTP